MTKPANADAAGTEGRRHALLIGVDAYPALSPGNQLYGSVNDALELRNFLTRQAHVPAENVRLLISSSSREPDALAARLADGRNIREAFAELGAAVGRRDHVILFYGGHGVRIQREDTPQRVYGFAPADLERVGGKFKNFVLDREINAFLHAIVDAGGTVTALIDTCHSGTTLRGIHDITVRGLPTQKLSSAEWEALTASHPDVQRPSAEAAQRSIGGGSGWFQELDRDWVMLSACHETEEANEDELDSRPHGLFTACLLRELRKVPAEAVKTLRWLDFFDTVRGAVRARADEMGYRQVPVLEGRPEKPVFGGEWQPYDPGFSAAPGSVASEVVLGGGVIDGLDVGAIVGVYPPGTVRFADAEAAGVTVLRAKVESATSTTSRARLLGPNAVIAEQSRARLLVPAPQTQKLAVTMTDVPEPIVAAVRATPRIADFVEFDPPGRRPDLEVCRWTREIPAWRKSNRPPWVGEKGGFALMPFTRGGPEAGRDEHDDVIAYVPPAEALGQPGAQGHASPEARLGRAIGEGILLWARYCSIVRLSHEDERLERLFEVSLRVGANEKAAKDPQACQTLRPSPSGTYELTAGQALWLDIRLDESRPERIFVAIVACSSDGNTLRVWPPQGGDPTFGRIGADEINKLAPRQQILVGRDRSIPAVPTIRPDQSAALYTFKVIVTVVDEDDPPPALAGLLLDRSVQEVIEDVLGPPRCGPTRGALDAADETSLRDAWHVWNLPVRVKRPAG